MVKTGKLGSEIDKKKIRTQNTLAFKVNRVMKMGAAVKATNVHARRHTHTKDDSGEKKIAVEMFEGAKVMNITSFQLNSDHPARRAHATKGSRTRRRCRTAESDREAAQKRSRAE